MIIWFNSLKLSVDYMVDSRSFMLTILYMHMSCIKNLESSITCSINYQCLLIPCITE